MSVIDMPVPVNSESLVGSGSNVGDSRIAFNAVVLVAEDNPVNQEVARMMLEVMGCRVDQAENGIEALKMSLEYPYDLILMDCEMPDMDGFSATRLIRDRERDEDGGRDGKGRVTIVAMTGNSSDQDRDLCLAGGMDDFLKKPFAFEDMNRLLKRWLPIINGTESPKRPPESRVGDDRVIDHSYLDNIRSLQREGEPDILARVLDNYISDAPAAIERVAAAVASSNCDEIRAIAHRFKSGSANVGATRLAGICCEMEKGAFSNSGMENRRLLENLRNEFETVTRVLSSIRQGGER